MDFVVNEWLPEYFKPTATAAEKEMLQDFLRRFSAKNDCIAVRRPSEFHRKILRYAKELQDDYEAVRPIRLFIKLVLEDSDRCQLIDDEVITLPQTTLNKLAVGNFSSDTYLFEAASQTTERLIVTTDEKLIKQFVGDADFKVERLSDFLKTY